jgi:hypothetical protein
VALFCSEVDIHRPTHDRLDIKIYIYLADYRTYVFLLLFLSHSGRLVGQVKYLDGGAVVFWVREASLTCRTSPVPIKKTTRFTIFYLLLRMIYLWFVAQKVLNRLYYALHGNPALTKAQADAFVGDLKFNDIQTIVKALRRKFPSTRTRITKWDDRSPKSNKTLDWLTTINHMMNLVSGEEPGQLLQVYMKQTHTASKLKVCLVLTTDDRCIFFDDIFFTMTQIGHMSTKSQTRVGVVPVPARSFRHRIWTY